MSKEAQSNALGYLLLLLKAIKDYEHQRANEIENNR